MVRVNGQQDGAAAGKALVDYLAEKGYDAARVAVERNGTIVPKGEFASMYIEDGDTLEIVGFVGGG